MFCIKIPDFKNGGGNKVTKFVKPALGTGTLGGRSMLQTVKPRVSHDLWAVTACSVV
jgi:hypothetical protein